jgi:anti-sigma regulatory factor (Ser/Thr protein kinase)
VTPNLDFVAVPPEVVVELPADPRAARMARDLLRTQASAVLSAAELEDALLLASEVVTNAVLHGTPPITLQVALLELPPGARVSVTDSREEPPAVRVNDRAADAGRGMAVVDALATRWGVERLPEGGKTIWFEVCKRRFGVEAARRDP